MRLKAMNNFMLKAMLLLAVLFCGDTSAFADSIWIWQDSIQYELSDDLTVCVRHADTNIKTANIPEKITYEGKDYAVTTIGLYAFENCRSLYSVVIPNSVKSIKDYAFYGCFWLHFVTIGSGVQSIARTVFVGQSMFGKDSYFEPDIVVWLGNTPPEGYKDAKGRNNYVSNNSFTGLSNTKIYPSMSSVFEKDGIKYVLVDSLKRTCAAIDCAYDAEVIKIPEYVIHEGKDYAVASIGASTFGLCRSLHSLTIGSCVQSIAAGLYDHYGYNHSGGAALPRKTIWLGNTPPEGYGNAKGLINYVSNDSFDSSWTKVYPFLSSMFEKDGIKYVPVNPSERTCDAIDCAYDSTVANVNIGNTVNYKGVELTVKDINPYTCYGNKYVKSVKIDYNGKIPKDAFGECDSMMVAVIAATQIGYSAFKGCGKLEDVMLDASLKSINSYAFEDCASLKGITIPDSVTGIGDRCFSGCKSLAYAKIGAGVSVIPDKTFYKCMSLPEITIPKTVDSIGNYVFYGCTSLTDVTIADRETELKLGSNGSSPMFSSCPLKSVYIGGNITYGTTADDGYSPFYRNTSLETVRTTDRENEISENEFYGCTSLKSVSMGDGIDKIGRYAFSGCSALESFSFGTGLKSIGDEAFSDCTGMKKLVSKTAVPPICGPQALDDINKWECTLYVPQESLDAYKSAAQWKEFFFLETGIKDAVRTSSATESARYSTDGTRLASPQKGINIIRMSDGTVKKVLVK